MFRNNSLHIALLHFLQKTDVLVCLYLPSVFIWYLPRCVVVEKYFPDKRVSDDYGTRPRVKHFSCQETVEIIRELRQIWTSCEDCEFWQTHHSNKNI